VFCRYEHSNLSDERIAELVTESLAAVGLKVWNTFLGISHYVARPLYQNKEILR
jgi:hypothetical protein